MAIQKRIFIIMLVVLLFLTGCSHRQIASDKAVMLGNKAIEIGEAYINGDIDGESARDDLEEILDRLSYANNYTYEETSNDEQKNADYHIHSYIFLLDTSILLDSMHNSDAESFDSVKEFVAELKKLIKKYG